jgi:uncharacterized repeat protein (TIGR03803 family)
MTKLSALRRAGFVFLLCGATAIAGQAQAFTTLYSFNGGDGGGPDGSLVQGEDGNFYGTTGGGGTNNVGTVFRITAQGTLTTLYSFCAQTNCPDGTRPAAALTLAVDGNLYGTTLSGGGSSNDGTVFRITPDGVLTTLYSFCAQTNCLDGAHPYGGLVQATDGNLYGTTAEGGASTAGTVFRITTGGTLTTIHSFCDKSGRGCGDSPRGSLIEATDGNLYGTTAGGGDRQGGGTAFRILPNGAFASKELHDGNAGGGGPMAGLLQGSDRNFYGTTVYGGSAGEGTVFEGTPTGLQTTLYTFCAHDGCSHGSQPTAGLVQATDGNLYGTTSIGGDITCQPPMGCGTVFQQ